MPYKIPKLRPETHSFLVKGTHYKIYDNPDPLIQLIHPYFINRENILLALPSFSEKDVTGILQLLKDRRAIILKREEELTPGTCPKAYDHVVCYNFIPTSNKKSPPIDNNTHIAVFLDYGHVAPYKPKNSTVIPFDHGNESWYKDLLNSITESLGKSFDQEKEFTVICQKTPTQLLNFIFAADEQLKVASLKLLRAPEGSCIFRKRDNQETIENCEYVQNISNFIERRYFIIADLDLEIIRQALEIFANITLIYTPQDFPVLEKVVELCDRSKAPVPDHIRNLSARK